MLDISLLMTALISGGAFYFCCCYKRPETQPILINVPKPVEIPPAYEKPPGYSIA